ncbi:MAG: VCBS repeat-containing protein [Rhizobiales bacterium]|nr:VCBS repeat-containing protein [Hyphomicrobiales bacterium]
MRVLTKSALIATLSLVISGATVALAKTSSVSADGWQATFSEPTNRYGHAVLGNTPEWGKLCLSGKGKEACVVLPKRSVFEDIAPRLVDVDRDGKPEAVVVESDMDLGAALAVYDLKGNDLRKIAAPNIGTSNRWLAPFAIGDLNGDGSIEIAYIDRPHVARILRVWSYQNDSLVELASKPGLTNHKVGQAFISGGLRDCGDGPEMITADAKWRNIVSSRLIKGSIESKVLAPFTGVASFEPILACQK